MIKRIIRLIIVKNEKLFCTNAASVRNSSIISPITTKSDESTRETKEKTESLLKVAIIGLPNAGKSTIINALMDRKVFAVSSKAHTTRCKAKAVFTQGNSQIVFIDTPGLVHPKEVKKFNLEKSFLKDSKNTLHEADVIGVIHDVSNHYTREKLDNKLINLLNNFSNKNSFLILNKIDLLKSKRKLLDVIRSVTEGHLNGTRMPNAKSQENDEIRGYRNFVDIFMVSALTGNGLDDLRNYLVKNAKPAKWLFPEEAWSDQSPENIIVNAVKAQLLNYLQQEIPYQCKVLMEFLDVNEEGVVTTVVIVKCPSQRIASLIAGTADGRLRQIIETTQNSLQNAFQNFVRLNIILEAQDNKIKN